MNLKQAAEMALEAMEKYCECGGLEDPIEELRQALSKREWVGLTDEEISQIWGCLPQTMDEEQDAINFGFAIEAKLKEKNT